jgi:hypothetical protein
MDESVSKDGNEASAGCAVLASAHSDVAMRTLAAGSGSEGL